MNMRYFLTILFLSFLLIACGSSGGNNTNGDDDDDNNDDTSINTEKLVGTPFEGMEMGDDLDWDLFVCGDYRTDTIESFPIKVFAAFFTGDEEIVVQEGIDIANEGIGFTAYELTNEWTDDVRVIYKVDEIESEGVSLLPNTVGQTIPIYYYFNGNNYSERQATDWAVEIDNLWVDKFIIAHEMGHASGIQGHQLIDYENNSFTDLEEGSLMSLGHSLTDPAMTDYNFMMGMQGQIMQNHLSETGTLDTERCD